MASLPFRELITAAIVVLVIIVSFKAGSGIAHAADRLSDITGIPIGSPSIKAFSAIPAANGNVRFQLSLAHSSRDVELKIYQLHSPTPDVDLANKAPDFIDKNVVYSIIPTSDEARKKLESGVVNDLCPQQASGTSGGVGCQGSTAFELGGYRFVAVLKNKGKVVDQKDALTGFYDENYVEMLNTKVSGCTDIYYSDCNVIACKKELINIDMGVGNLELRKTSGVLRKISDEFRAEKDFSASNDCGKVGDAFGNPVPPNRNKFGDSYFVVKGCSDKDVDGLNIKVARARLLESAYSMNLVDSEDKYSAHSDRLKVWKDEAARITMSCTGFQPLSLATNVPGGAPVGAYNALAKLNWQFVPIGSTPSIWKGEVNAELDRVINNNLHPVQIASLRADGFDNYRISLSWVIPVEQAKVKAGSYKISRFYTRLGGVVNSGNPKVMQDETVLPGQKADGNVLTSFQTSPGLPAGKHEFEVRVFEGLGATGSELALANAATGLFDDTYIETYKGGDGNCVTKRGDAAFVPVPYSDHNCNVAATKKKILESTLGGASTAYSKSNINKALCTMSNLPPSPGQLSDGCTPEDIDIIYKNYVTEMGISDFYNCVFPANAQGIYYNSAKAVCIVKRQVVNTLVRNGWNDLRVNKGWEASV